MASLFSSSPQILLYKTPHLSLRSFTLALPFPHSLSSTTPTPQICAALKATGPEGGLLGSPDPSLLRRPLISPPPEEDAGGSGVGDAHAAASAAEAEDRGAGEVQRRSRRRKGEDWEEWEDKILGDTVPLVGFVRMILHSATYESGDRLSQEHEKTIMERLLPYHPDFKKKIGCGIDFITVGYHPEFENSRCLFIKRKDGELMDFSYWKCIKGLIRKNYPLYADSFILRHFRRRRDE